MPFKHSPFPEKHSFKICLEPEEDVPWRMRPSRLPTCRLLRVLCGLLGDLVVFYQNTFSHKSQAGVGTALPPDPSGCPLLWLELSAVFWFSISTGNDRVDNSVSAALLVPSCRRSQGLCVTTTINAIPPAFQLYLPLFPLCSLSYLEEFMRKLGWVEISQGWAEKRVDYSWKTGVVWHLAWTVVEPHRVRCISKAV